MYFSNPRGTPEEALQAPICPRHVSENALSTWCAFQTPPQVNQRISANRLNVSVFQQSARYTCGSSTGANLLQTCFSGRSAQHQPPQVNRHNPCNSLCPSVFLQNVRYTCGKSPDANMPQICFSGRSAHHHPLQVNQSVFSNRLIISVFT